MFEKNRKNLRSPQYALLPAACLLLFSVNGNAQDAQGVKPSGAAGMATSVPQGSGNQLQLMQARAQSREARQESNAAALSRSADQALENRNQSTALDDARRLKQLKQQAARQMEFEKSQNAYKKVSSNDISLWGTKRGGIKVERDAPPAIQNYLNAPPTQAMAPTMAQPEVEEESGGFSPFKKAGNAAKKLNPFKKDDAPQGITAPNPETSSFKQKEPGLFKKMPLIGGLGKKDERSGISLESPVEEEKKGFLKNLGKKKDDADVAVVEEKKGFLKGMTSKIPFVGKKDEPVAPVPAPVQQAPQNPAPEMVTATQDPVRVQGSAVADGISQVPNNTVSAPNAQTPTVAPTAGNGSGEFTTANTLANQAPAEKPGFMGRIKNAGNKMNPFSKKDETIASAETSQPATSIAEDDKPGFMGRLLNRDQPEAASNAETTIAAAAPEADKPKLMDRFRGIGGNGSGNRVGGAGTIDSSLFPEGSTSAAPTGGELKTVANAAAPTATAPAVSGPTGEFASTPQQALPGEEKKGFSIPKIEIAVPDFSEVGKPDPTEPKMWKERTTTHKGGSNYYVVNETTNFMKFGSGVFSSETTELTAGTVVKMTKPGDEWATVQLSDGSRGNLKNKALRPATQAEIPASFGTGSAPGIAASAPSTIPVGR